MTTNFFPDKICKIYLMGICGTGMGSLAGLLKERGFDVCGSDANVYPPMSDELAKQDIPIFAPYSADNLANARPDLVIVGNVIPRVNVEAQYLIANKIPQVSMPQSINRFFLQDKEVIVLSGTHGKTTTTALMAFLLNRLKLDPSYLVGGVSQDFGQSFHIGKGKYFVIEGDEYDTAFFDKGPKFLHYNPTHVVMTSLEFDHADIYRDLAHVTESFNKLADIIPTRGSLHFCDEYKTLIPVAQRFSGPQHSYGFASHDRQITHFTSDADGIVFDLEHKGQKIIGLKSQLSGRHNALNIAACFSVLEKIGADLEEAARALPEFRGIKRRQEVLFEDDHLVVIDDFAHHPTAVTETILAIKSKYRRHHLVAIFEPRSNTTIRAVFQQEYTQSFMNADATLLAAVFNPKKIGNEKILDVEKIVADLKTAGHSACYCPTTQEIMDQVLAHPKKKLVALIMSNGGFDNIHRRLIEAWKNRKFK